MSPPPSRGSKSRKAGKAFEALWIRFPTTWRKVLHGSSGTVYELALTLLAEAYRLDHSGFEGEEITLSAAFTGLSKITRKRAIKKLEELGLIELHRQTKGQSYRATLKKLPD